jgi:hypothetical protein
LNSLILQKRFVVSIELYMNLSKLLECDLLSLTPLSLVLDTSSAPMLQPCFFVTQTNELFFFLLYVDEMIITRDELSGIQKLKQFLSQPFEMKDHALSTIFLVLKFSLIPMVTT